MRKTTVASLEQAKANPNAIGRNATVRAVLGADHPYASPFGGRGTAALFEAEPDLGMAQFWFALLVFFDVVFVTLALWTFEPLMTD